MEAIERLLTVPEDNRDVAWLKEALQEALELELSTIPPYLYAWWSIDSGPASNAISDVVQEEMLHMACACNLLAGIGGTPVIADKDSVPIFPGKLKAGIHADLTVGLEPFSQPLVFRAFMRIEEPQKNVANLPEFVASGNKLIGQFYDAIKTCFTEYQPALDAAKQLDLTGLFGVKGTASNAAEAASVIDIIVDQGEGTSAGPFENGAGGELAHFYRFAELYKGASLAKQPSANGLYDFGPAIAPSTTIANVPTNPPSNGANHAFDVLYSAMLQDLQDAWQMKTKLGDIVGRMSDLTKAAVDLMKAGSAPAFIYIPGTPGTAGPAAPPANPGSPFQKVKAILDAAVVGHDLHFHGKFWQGATRDQFVSHTILGMNIVKVGDGPNSNIVKAMRGQAPFGSDTGTAGATIRRMPAGLPPIADADIQFIQDWINSGCPDPAAAGLRFMGMEMLDMASGTSFTPEQHNAFWRDFDDWALFHVQPDISAAIQVAFSVAMVWMQYAKDPSKEAAYQQALQAPGVADAISLLSARQIATVQSHYGIPTPILAILDSFQQFGADTLPDDPLRPQDVRHRMNDPFEWFIWTGFADAAIRLNDSKDFWQFYSRALLCGLLNEGLIRKSFPVTGLTPGPAGQLQILTLVQPLSPDELSAEIKRRFIDSKL